MKNNKLSLGIDTSNYTTSVALTGFGGEIIKDLRKPLQVKQGERGLRQSHALFQHIENLPGLLEEILDSPLRMEIKAVSASDRPRRAEGSYMPVFNGGCRFGKVAAAALGVPFFCFSHQEGHLAAAVHGTALAGRFSGAADALPTGGGLETAATVNFEAEAGSEAAAAGAFRAGGAREIPREPAQSGFLAWHLSGGTCELLRVDQNRISILGGTKDLSFGQLIDRVGVAMGLSFPCGGELDRLALRASQRFIGEMEKPLSSQEGRRIRPVKNPLKAIPVDGLAFNASGIETQAQRSLDQLAPEDAAFFIFQRIEECLIQVTQAACRQEDRHQILFMGGVAASACLRAGLERSLAAKGIEAVFGQRALSSDNGVGISLLGGQALWR